VRYLFVILSLLGFMTLSESIPSKRVGGNGAPAARRVVVRSAPAASTMSGEVSAFEDGTPSPRR
jgi:hypothetical protein